VSNLKNVEKQFAIIMISIIILLSTISIRLDLSGNNVHYMYITIGIFSFLYYICNRGRIVHDKIDFWVAILSFSTLIPLIFKSYISLSQTIYGIIKYFAMLNMFLIVKNECKKSSKRKHIILNIIIITILFLCIIGLDEIGKNYLKNFKNFMGFLNLGLKENRIGSLFCYANTIAIVAGAGVFLCIGYVFNSKKIISKIIYTFLSIIMFVTMVLTYSRLAFIVFGVVTLVFVLILCKKYKVKEKTNKKVILTIGVIAIFAVIYLIIGMQISDNLIVKKSYMKKIFEVQPSTDYVFSFDINSVSNEGEKFTIEIIEKNEYLDKVKTTKKTFGTFSGQKEIKIQTKEDTTAIYIKIKNKSKEGTLKINNLYINNEEVILKYKLLPTKIVDKIMQTSLGQKSAWQRFVFIKDAFKQINENWLFGLGGNAWRTVQLESQEYSYYAKEVHSFPTQIFLENGIIGFIACIAIGVSVLKILYKETKREKIDLFRISIIMAILSIFLHSIFDFNMSFFYVLLIVFLMIAVLEDKRTEKQEKNKFAQVIIKIFLIIMSSIIAYTMAVEIYFNNNTQVITTNKEWDAVRIFDTYYKLIPFNEEVKKQKYRALQSDADTKPQQLQETLKEIIEEEKNNISNTDLDNIFDFVRISIKCKENIKENMEFALEYIYSTENHNIYNPDRQIERFRNLKRIIELLTESRHQEYVDMFKEQLTKEIEEKKDEILDYNKGRYKKEGVKYYKRQMKEILKEIEKENQRESKYRY